MRHFAAMSPPLAAPVAQPLRVLALAGALLLGCTDRPLGGGEAGNTSTGDATGDATTTTTSTTTTTGSPGSTGPVLPTTGGVTSEPPPPDTSTGPAMTGSSGPDTSETTTECPFICVPDLPPDNADCPGTQQLDPECPEGHKCTIEESLGDTQCEEVVPDPKGLYEPCTMMDHAWSGFDDCGLGMVCWGVDERGHGTCVGMCDGSPDCVCADPKAKPTWCQECAVGLCLPGCDPLLQDCANDELCVGVNDGFNCVPDASGDEGQANDPCEFVNVCDKGLMCGDAAFVGAGCPPGSTGCCTPFCAFPGGACPNPDQQCVQYFDPMQLPENDPQLGIGVCGLPK